MNRFFEDAKRGFPYVLAAIVIFAAVVWLILDVLGPKLFLLIMLGICMVMAILFFSAAVGGGKRS